MSSWYKTILENIAQQKISFFDVETSGLTPDDKIYSASFAGYGSDDIRTHYMQDADITGWSKFSKDAYAKVVQSEGYKKSGLKSKTPGIIAAEEFEKRLAAGELIIGHNVGFDINAIAQENYSAAFNIKQMLDVPGEISPHTAVWLDPAVKRNVNRGQYFNAFQLYTGQLEYRLKAGKGTLADTQIVAQLFMGMAEQSGQVKFKGDRFTGSNMEMIGKALGVNMPLGTHDELDVLANREVFSRLMKIGSETDFKNNRLSGDAVRFLNKIQSIQKDFATISLDKNLSDLVLTAVQRETNPQFVKEGIFHKGALGPKEQRYYATTIQEALNTSRFDRSSIAKLHSGLSGDEWTAYVQNKAEKKIFKYHKAIEAGEKRGIPREEMIDRIWGSVNTRHKKRTQDIISTIDAGATKSALSDMPVPKIQSLKKFGLWGGIAIGAASLVAAASRIPGRDDAYNTIEGLHVGAGDNSPIKRMIEEETDFGSGWKGILKSASMEFLKNLQEQKHIAAIVAVPGFIAGYDKGQEEGNFSLGYLAGAMALDLTDDMLIAAGPGIAKRYPGFEKNFETLSTILNSKLAKQVGIGFFGFTAGKVLGEITGSLTSVKDHPSLIEQRHEGVAGARRVLNTDFGSAYQGPNPSLEPEYNKAKEVYAKDWFRASAIGLSEAEMYERMAYGQDEMSEYVMASASAGTALHQLGEAEGHRDQLLKASEELLIDYAHGITGHVDEVHKALGPGDVKTVSDGIFQTLQRASQPKPMHRSQLMFYLGQMGAESGYIKYVNRDKPHQEKIFRVRFNPAEYEALINKVERVRARVNADLARGILDESALPMTASVTTLIKADRNKPTPEEMIDNIDRYQEIFQEEMEYLRSVKRGMPTAGSGYDRIEKRRREKRESAMISTQGIGLQAWNNRSMHHVM